MEQLNRIIISKIVLQYFNKVGIFKPHELNVTVQMENFNCWLYVFEVGEKCLHRYCSVSYSKQLFLSDRVERGIKVIVFLSGTSSVSTFDIVFQLEQKERNSYLFIFSPSFADRILIQTPSTITRNVVSHLYFFLQSVKLETFHQLLTFPATNYTHSFVVMESKSAYFALNAVVSSPKIWEI